MSALHPTDQGHLSSIPPRARKASGWAFGAMTLAMLFAFSPVALALVIAVYSWERGQ